MSGATADGARAAETAELQAWYRSKIQRQGPEEEYDPCDPKNITPATEEEVVAENARLLLKQIDGLDSALARRSMMADLQRDAKVEPVLSHYNSVLDDFKERAGGCGKGLTEQRQFRYRARPSTSRALVNKAVGCLSVLPVLIHFLCTLQDPQGSRSSSCTSSLSQVTSQSSTDSSMSVVL